MVVAESLQFQWQEQDQDTCPRCKEKLRVTYRDQEPECWTCGYVDYSYIPKIRAAKSYLASGTQFLLRYIGDYSTMKEKLVLVHVLRGNGAAKLRHQPECPFCGKGMDIVSLSGKHRQRGEERFTCPADHRISLPKGQNGPKGWK